MENKSVFATLNAINCNEHTEKKGNLTYLSWAWAWQMVKQNYPGATYTIYEDANGTPYFTDGRTAWVKTGVTIEGIEHIEYLPIMDFNNRSIPLDKITSTDMNKTIQRSLTKACARHGLGLYIYAGEDLPEKEAETSAPQGEGRKKGSKKLAEPALDPYDDPNLQDAIEAAKSAKSQAELTQVWKDWKPRYESEPTFVQAIKSNPFHPSHKNN